MSTKCHMDCLQKVSTNVERSHRPPWPQPAAHAHASSADSMAGPPTAVGTATEAVGGNWDVCSGPDRSSVWKRPCGWVYETHPRFEDVVLDLCQIAIILGLQAIVHQYL